MDDNKYNDNRYVKKWANTKRAMDALGGKCQKCGETHIATLSFHHVDPLEKEGLVAELVKGRDWNVIEQEIKKCVLLCENCHRKTHFDEERYHKFKQEIYDKAAGVKNKKEINIKKWSLIDTNKLIELYNKNLNVYDIAHSMNRMDSTIRSRIEKLKKEGTISDRDVSVKRKTLVKITDEIKKEICALHNNHLSPMEISSKLGVSLRTVFKYQKGE